MSKKHTEYQIVETQKKEDLVKAVMEQIRLGWQCQGGVGIDSAPQQYSFYSQAMVR